MNKSPLKNYLKFGIYLCGISIVVFSCQKETIEDFKETAQERRVKRISLSTLKARHNKSNDFVKLSSMFDVNKSKDTELQERLEASDNPYLLTDEIVMIEKEGATYYTFRVETQTESDNFYNFVVVFDDIGNILSTRILEYIPNEIWFADTSQPFVGEVKSQENEFFSVGEINNLFSARGIGQCITGVSYIWNCGANNDHAPNHTFCTTDNNAVTEIVGINIQYGACPPELTQGDDGGYPVDTSPGGGGGGGSGSGTSNNNDNNDCVPAIDNPCEEDETAILTPRDNDEEPLPCDNIEKLKNDDVFKQKMVALKNAAQQWSFEQLFTVSTDPTPNTSPAQSDNYNYDSFQGTINQPSAQWSGVNASTFQGIIHSHYSGLLSIQSVTDLADMYNVMKISSVTDNFFYGLVNDAGTAYILQINDREAFLEFGEKNLSSKKKIDNFVKYKLLNKYNVKIDNTNTQNEKGFVEMIKGMNSGITTFKSTDNTYSNYKELSILNNQVVEIDCN